MGLARTIAERLSRNRVVCRRLPANFGRAPVVLSPGSALQYWRFDTYRHSADILDFAAAFVRPGDTAWDVGASLGIFAIAAAHKAGASGCVVAVEPFLDSVALIRRSASAQPPASAPVIVVPGAVADSPALLELAVAKRGRNANHLAVVGGSTSTGGTARSEHVLAVTLDWLWEATGRAPSVLKIDVETAELLVLQGAQRLLAEAKPVVLIEVDSANANAVGEILKGAGYTLFDWDARNGTERNGTELAVPAFNTLALPPDRATERGWLRT